MGQGELWDQGGYAPAHEVLKKKDFQPLQYMEKEGLAMNNGTQMMTALNVETVWRARHAMRIANTTLALTAFATNSNIKQLLSVSQEPELMEWLAVLLEGATGHSALVNPKSI